MVREERGRARAVDPWADCDGSAAVDPEVLSDFDGEERFSHAGALGGEAEAPKMPKNGGLEGELASCSASLARLGVGISLL